MQQTLAWPNYADGSIGNLIASLRAAWGGTSAFDPLPGLSVNALSQAPCVLLLVIDGLGQALMQRALSAKGGLRQRQTHTLHSMFPSTTASAITTLMTGMSPAEHAVSGWFMFERQTGQVIVPLPFQARAGRVPLEAQGLEPAQLFPHSAPWHSAECEHQVLMPKAIANSAFSQHFFPCAQVGAYRDARLKAFLKGIERMAKGAKKPRFGYAYWSELDTLQHQLGPSAPEVASALQALEQGLLELWSRIADTGAILLLSADHGQCDIPREQWRQIQDYPRLHDCLSLPLCGEPRAAYAYTQARKWRELRDRVEGEHADWLSIYDSHELLESGCFGPGEIHPKMRERVGDYVLMPAAGITLNDRLLSERRKGHLGEHSGLTPAELEVPLCVWGL